MLAMLQDGQAASLEDMAKYVAVDEEFSPQMAQGDREHLLAGWQKAVERTDIMTLTS